MLPVLFYAREKLDDANSDLFNVRWTFKFLIKELELSKEVLDVKLKSGQSKFDNNVRWVISDLFNAKLLERGNRGYYKITPRGLDVLEENPRRLSRNYLMKFSEFREYMSRNRKKNYVPDDQSRLI